MATEEELRAAQMRLSEEQLKNLVKPWHKDGKEILKLTASVAALLGAIIAGYLQVEKGVLTAELVKTTAELVEKREQLDRVKERMEFYYGSVSVLKTIPEELIGVLQNQSQSRKLNEWELEALSDAFILSAAYNEVCGDTGQAKEDLTNARKFDSNDSDFKPIETAIEKLRGLPLKDGLDFEC